MRLWVSTPNTSSLSGLRDTDETTGLPLLVPGGVCALAGVAATATRAAPTSAVVAERVTRRRTPAPRHRSCVRMPGVLPCRMGRPSLPVRSLSPHRVADRRSRTPLDKFGQWRLPDDDVEGVGQHRFARRVHGAELEGVRS